MKKFLLLWLWLCFYLFLAGCTDAEIASYNISKRSDFFEVPRRVIFYNGITNEYILDIEWYCSLQTSETYDPTWNDVAVICKDWDWYKKHYLWLSDNVTYIVEQIDSANVSKDHYKVIFKPASIIPSVEIR